MADILIYRYKKIKKVKVMKPMIIPMQDIEPFHIDPLTLQCIFDILMIIAVPLVIVIITQLIHSVSIRKKLKI